MGNAHKEILSPSESARWINCPQSFVYEKNYKLLDEYERKNRIKPCNEGTIAHEVAETILNLDYSRHSRETG